MLYVFKPDARAGFLLVDLFMSQSGAAITALAAVHTALAVGDSAGTVTLYALDREPATQDIQQHHAASPPTLLDWELGPVGRPPRPRADLSLYGAVLGSFTAHAGHAVLQLHWALHLGLVTCSAPGVGVTSLHDLVTRPLCQHTHALGDLPDAADPLADPLLAAAPMSAAGGIHAIAVTRRAIAVAQDHLVSVWDPLLGVRIGSLHAHGGSPVVGLVAAEQCGQLIVVTADKRIRAYDLASLRPLQALADSLSYAPVDVLTAAAYDPVCDRLITAGARFRVWPLRPEVRAGSGAAHGASVVSLCHAPQFKQLVSVGADASVVLWDLRTLQSHFQFSAADRDNDADSVDQPIGGHSSVGSACLDHKARKLVVARTSGRGGSRVGVWNVNSGLYMGELARVRGEVTGLLGLRPDCDLPLVGWSPDCGVVRWELDAPPHAPSKPFLQAPKSADVSSCATWGSLVVTGSLGGTVTYWSTDSGKEVCRHRIPATVAPAREEQPASAPGSRGHSRSGSGGVARGVTPATPAAPAASVAAVSSASAPSVTTLCVALFKPLSHAHAHSGSQRGLRTGTSGALLPRSASQSFLGSRKPPAPRALILVSSDDGALHVLPPRAALSSDTLTIPNVTHAHTTAMCVLSAIDGRWDPHTHSTLAAPPYDDDDDDAPAAPADRRFTFASSGHRRETFLLLVCELTVRILAIDADALLAQSDHTAPADADPRPTSPGAPDAPPLRLVRCWQAFPTGLVTAATAVPALGCFALASDSGAVLLVNTRGQQLHCMGDPTLPGADAAQHLAAAAGRGCARPYDSAEMMRRDLARPVPYAVIPALPHTQPHAAATAAAAATPGSATASAVSLPPPEDQDDEDDPGRTFMSDLFRGADPVADVVAALAQPCPSLVPAPTPAPEDGRPEPPLRFVTGDLVDVDRYCDPPRPVTRATAPRVDAHAKLNPHAYTDGIYSLPRYQALLGTAAPRGYGHSRVHSLTHARGHAPGESGAEADTDLGSELGLGLDARMLDPRMLSWPAALDKRLPPETPAEQPGTAFAHAELPPVVPRGAAPIALANKLQALTMNK
jgi:hypothetical protein